MRNWVTLLLCFKVTNKKVVLTVVVKMEVLVAGPSPDPELHDDVTGLLLGYRSHTGGQ